MVADAISLTKIAAVIAKEGYKGLKRLRPEYAVFWKTFEAKLKPRARDVPWDRLKELRLDFEFVGEAVGLMRGEVAKRKAMRKRVAKLAQPPEGSEYDSDEIVEIVMKAAEEAAVKAIRDDRGVTAMQGKMTRGQIEENQREILEKLAGLEALMLKQGAQPGRLADAGPLTPGNGGRAHKEARAPRKSARSGAGPTARREVREAETELKGILDTDPGVEAAIERAALPTGEFAYRPDFLVKDQSGINWLVALEAEPVLKDPDARSGARRYAALATAAARSLPEDWRFAVVTPGDLTAADSWADVVVSSKELTDSWLQ